MSSSAPGISSKLPHSGQNNRDPIKFVFVAMSILELYMEEVELTKKNLVIMQEFTT